MIFNDIIDNLNSVEPYIRELLKFNETAMFIIDKSNDLLLYAFQQSYINVSSSNYDSIRNISSRTINEIDKEIKNQDLFKLGTTYSKIIDTYNKTFDPSESADYDLPGEGYSETIRSLIISMYNFNSAVRSFLSRDTDSTVKSFSTLILRSKQFIEYYNKYYELRAELNLYKNKLENTWDGINENNTLTIRLFRETITLSEITKYNECIEKMYSIICRGLDISSDDSVLLPVKIETGSLYEKLKGKEDAISLFISILTFSYTIFHDNFSDISKLNSQVEQANFIKSKIEIVGLAKEQGLEISEDSKKCLEAEITDLLNNSLTLTKNNTKIQINNTTIDLVPQEDLLKFLSESRKPQIESSNN